MVLEDGYLYEIAKVDGFVSSRDFINGLFNLVTRSHGRSAFSGCQMVFFTRLQRQPVLFLHKISRTAGLVLLRNLTGGWHSVVFCSVLS